MSVAVVVVIVMVVVMVVVMVMVMLVVAMGLEGGGEEEEEEEEERPLEMKSNRKCQRSLGYENKARGISEDGVDDSLELLRTRSE
jgi:flagellar basal body-associated protein FliL